MKQKILVYLGWLISVIFIYLAFKDLDWNLIVRAFKEISLLTPIAMVGVYCLGFILRSWRWRLLLPKGVSFSDSLGAVVLGYAANNLLPARLGELVRAQALGKKSGISRSFVLASILVERVVDGLVVTGLLYLGILGSEIPYWASTTGLIGIALFGSISIGILTLAATESIWKVKVDTLSNPRFKAILQQFSQGLTLIGKNPSLTIALIGMTATIWLVEGLMYLISIQAFNLQVPKTAALFVMGVINLGILVPSAPGYLGTFQYFGVLALSAWQIPPDQALACVVLIHICQYLPITLWGLAYLPYFGFTSLGSLSHDIK